MVMLEKTKNKRIKADRSNTSIIRIFVENKFITVRFQINGA